MGLEAIVSLWRRAVSRLPPIGHGAAALHVGQRTALRAYPRKGAVNVIRKLQEYNLFLKSAYWVSTGLLALLYLASATMYAADLQGVQALFGTLGYPGDLVPILAVAKVLAVIALLSRVSVGLSDLVYAGMFYHLLLSFSAHFFAGDLGFGPAVIALVLLAVSVATQNVARAKQSPYGRLSRKVSPSSLAS